MASSKISLKLIIDKKEQRVLYAEAGKDFTDFLFSLLVLPVGTVMRLIGTVNGIAKLNQSVSDLNDDYIQSNQKKDFLLKPKSSLPFASPQVPLLPTEAYSSSLDILSTSGVCPCCNRTMSAVELESLVAANGGGFVKEAATFMVMDDLAVSPMPTMFNLTVLKNLNINDLGSLEEKLVHFGIDQGLQLLKHSLNSKTVLTDVFLRLLTKKRVIKRKCSLKMKIPKKAGDKEEVFVKEEAGK